MIVVERRGVVVVVRVGIYIQNNSMGKRKWCVSSGRCVADARLIAERNHFPANSVLHFSVQMVAMLCRILRGFTEHHRLK
jgi:hypothetical protein